MSDTSSMMDTLHGQFLVAMPNMGDPRFEKTVIFICAHTSDGAMGFVVNKTIVKPTVPDFLQQLAIVDETELDRVPDQVKQMSLHSGGPVEPGRGFVLHSSEFRADTTMPVNEDVSLTATLEILRSISMGRGPRRRLLMLGYSGWAGGQLEEEIAANGWLTTPADSEILFAAQNESKYDRVLLKMGVDPRLLSGEAGHA